MYWSIKCEPLLAQRTKKDRCMDTFKEGRQAFFVWALDQSRLFRRQTWQVRFSNMAGTRSRIHLITQIHIKDGLSTSMTSTDKVTHSRGSKSGA